MTRIDPIAQALAQLECNTWCSPGQGWHVEDCPLQGAAVLAAEQAAYARRVAAFGVPALVAPYSRRTAA